MDQEFRVDEGYSFLVTGRPSKILSSWSYESIPKPLRSSRRAGEFRETDAAPETDAPETDDETNAPEYKEFCDLLMNGQKIADKTRKTHFFTWRGYRACISSQLPRLSKPEINRRFKLAMETIRNLEKGESQPDTFKKPSTPSSDSQPNSLSSPGSQQQSSSQNSSTEEPTQIPETQFHMEGKLNSALVFNNDRLTLIEKRRFKFCYL